MTSIVVKDLTVEYRTGPYRVRPIDELDMEVEPGELAVLLGASGCGKTTLLSVLAGILTPQTGSVTVDGQAVGELTEPELIHYRRHTVGVVFQTFNLMPSLSAAENVAVPLWSAGVANRQAKGRAEELLQTVGLSDRAGHRPSELSGGQQQRVAIARALAHDPPVILADEPTAHLDPASVQDVLAVLRGLAGPGRLVVIATHDDRIRPLADRVVDLTRIRDGRSPDEQRRRELRPDEQLFAAGDRGTLVYLVEKGWIELTRERSDGTEEVLADVGPGGYFGELAPMLQLPRSATARADREGAVVTGMTLPEFRSLTRGRDRVDDAPNGAPDRATS